MSSMEYTPASPDEPLGDDVPTPGSEASSEATTPFEESFSSPNSIANESHKRLPSLRSVSDPRNMNPNSTALGILGMARNPKPMSSSPSSFVGSGVSLDNSALAKARALQQQRLQKGSAPGAGSPVSPSPSLPLGQSNGGPSLNGFPGNMRLPAQLPSQLHRPPPQAHPNSAPAITKSSLSERRAKMGVGMGMKLSDIGGGSPSPGSMRRAGAPKLSDMGAGSHMPTDPGPSHGSKMDDFKKYIDAEKGWITFDGAATITRTGVNFSNGSTFKISLDEVEILSELGKGNYGTVYKVKHAKPKAPRFGTGLSGSHRAHIGQSHSEVSPAASEDASPIDPAGKADGTTGMTMAMKEIRLELDDAKFTTILKELVILHECISPYIIDFYGAFFQEGAVYICIEYMDGGSIDKLYQGGIPESVLRKITYSTVQGLKSLKDDHNIIHRDVKPTNILANSRGQVKICDFGVSGNLVASIAKTNIGCQSYMAPERISGGGMAPSGNAEGTYSVQSDVWSLGLTIIECAMGRYPYPPEVSSTIFSQLSAIVEGEPPNLPDEGYSDLARDFVKACLHKIPRMRPTYAMLLKHPWLEGLTKPQTITEEAEEGDEAEQIAEAVGNITLDSTTADEEVANWVKSVLRAGKDNTATNGSSRPALHAAPLDGVSPQASPQIGGP